MNKRYLRNGNRFDKYGNYIAGFIVEQSCSRIKTEDPAAGDRENRNQVVRKIEELVDKGVPVKEACERVVKDYKDKFEYLQAENLSQIFANWYNGRHKNENKSIEDRTC